MSHSKERAEKNCLNCGETVQGRYCQVCGQENTEPKESLWGLVSHFFQDITHFDGKFFSTGKLLFTKPGFLPKEYLSGRRARYLHPIRMYVFTSALFFLIFYSVFDVRNLGLGKKRQDKKQTAAMAVAKARSLKTASTKEDSAQIEKTFRMIGRLPIDVTIDENDIKAENNDRDEDEMPAARDALDKKTTTVKKDTSDKKDTSVNNDTSVTKKRIYRYNSSDTVDSPATNDVTRTNASSGKNGSSGTKKSSGTNNPTDAKDSSKITNSKTPKDSSDKNEDSGSKSEPAENREFGILDISKTFMNAYDSRAEYDSVQATLPPEARDGWIKRRFAYQNIEFKQRYGDDEGELIQDLLDKFIHTFPYLLFISLPLYALFLKLLYIRRKRFFYADHGLFLIYLYIFTFLHLLVFFGLRALKERWDYWWLGLIMFLFILYGIYYAYKSMRKFYEQGRGKTILKFILLNILSFTTITLLFVLFFFIALLRL
ncbi:DUF3667 domain-containing protein [Flavitalea sp.]|nr:DUF3667 domain-containing protein [Flavitalea sp.]